jgi:Asp-tRNA(Asn)/Glu-tRNA(Gln) amidotransferase A subunit family amidase
VPSSLCGVWGLKPTFGRLSRRGSYPFVHSVDHLGPFADSVERLALCLRRAAVARPAGPGLPRDADRAGDAVAGARRRRPAHRSLLGGYFHDNATPPAREAARTAAAALGTTEMVEWPDPALARAAAFITSASEGGALHLDDLRTRADDFEPLSVDRFIAGALQPAAWYLRRSAFAACTATASTRCSSTGTC